MTQENMKLVFFKKFTEDASGVRRITIPKELWESAQLSKDEYLKVTIERVEKE